MHRFLGKHERQPFLALGVLRSQAWFSQRTRTEAETALTKIQPRPPGDHGDHKGKLRHQVQAVCLKFAISSSTTPEFKLEAAREAYRQGLAVMTGSITLKQRYQDLRTAA
jgi:hypothetical protein